MKATALIITLLFGLTSLIAQENWMSRLPDSLPASKVSIPGAHDSATGEGIKGIIKLGITQKKSIAEQWSCGIRAFDFRPAINKEDIHIYHGPLKTKITLPAAIDTLLDCIKRNPEEFAVVIMRQERGGNNDEERKQWSHRIGEYINTLGDKAATFHPTITVGELRGKILFLSRNHYDNSHKGALISCWSHSQQGTKKATITPYSPNNTTSATLFLQDLYSPTTENLRSKKAEIIIQFIDAARTAEPGIWCINHLSGYSSTLLGFQGIATNKGYRQNAARNNLVAYNHLTQTADKSNVATKNTAGSISIKHSTIPSRAEKKKNSPPHCCGIIMIDYAGCEKIGRQHIYGQSIIRAIIECNFRHK